MADHFPLKMKRKDLEDVNEDFSDFSLSSAARKIRRLDAELPPIVEEAESEIPTVVEQSLPQEQGFGRINSGGWKIEELPPENEERAIVLFKPVNNTTIVHSPSNFSVSVDPDLISGFKNQFLWSKGSNSWQLDNDEAAEEDGNVSSSNRCLAVVPWVPSPLPSATETDAQTDTCEMMDAEEMEGETMDIEDGIGAQQRSFTEAGRTSLTGELQQWQQQHCMIPQPPEKTSTPIFWYR